MEGDTLSAARKVTRSCRARCARGVAVLHPVVDSGLELEAALSAARALP